MTENRSSLTRFAWISIGASLLTLTLKSGAYLLTNSVGFLSDAVESLVNLAAGVMALAMLTVAARPADEDHAYGHSKAEYFSSAVEGILILVAAGGIIVAAVQRFLDPQPLEQLGIGLVVSAVASLVNFAAARVLFAAGKRAHSITLEADAHHLMTDVWTSVGVIAGVGVVAVTHWQPLDPIIAILVGLNIIRTAYQLLRRSVAGLMDASLPEAELKVIETVMSRYRERGVAFHALRTRQAAARRFVSVHMLAPGAWTLHDAHHIAEDFEGDVRRELADTIVQTHLEPVDDEISMRDVHDR
ncbi:MAG: transporter [Anaerolineaceae bacterium]|nr:cation transporter [Anaerolineae bacterium]MDL1925103.1 cation transporter [Anaerolineae bacterium AMX1]WKZ54433.1 MAG: cation diffusion facilitator family transporter [Anaerolineales bacterium]GIK10912.1 MAG: transporter [Chloroflexota bacterium]GJQ38713.1 MAG: transporter [Anaerolineaceae bacterium]